MFNFQGLAGQKNIENFDVKTLSASKIKLSAKAIETIGLTEEKSVFLDREVTTKTFWIAAVAEGGKKLSKQNTFGHKVLNSALGEGTEWDIDVASVQEVDGVQYFKLVQKVDETTTETVNETVTEGTTTATETLEEGGMEEANDQEPQTENASQFDEVEAVTEGQDQVSPVQEAPDFAG